MDTNTSSQGSFDDLQILYQRFVLILDNLEILYQRFVLILDKLQILYQRFVLMDDLFIRAVFGTTEEEENNGGLREWHNGAGEMWFFVSW